MNDSSMFFWKHIPIEIFIVDPLLQPWAGPPNSLNRIIIIFDKNGMTYLIKAIHPFKKLYFYEFHRNYKIAV